jgi:hypothetical protein
VNPRNITQDDVDMYSDAHGLTRVATFTGEGDPDPAIETHPVQAIITPNVARDGGTMVHVAWMPDEIDLARLANGGTLWLTCWGGLPPHNLQVIGGDR